MAVLALFALVLLSAPAYAAPAVVPRPLCCIPSGPVNAVAVSGNTAYFGGDFRHLGIPAHRWALVDAVSGQPKAGQAHLDDGFIEASVSDGSGGWYVGGTFTSIGGVPHAHLAHVLANGSVDPNWAAATDGAVDALIRTGGVVYAGGSFTQVNGGTARDDVAGFDQTTGAVTSFTANTNGYVRALASSSHPTFDGPVSRIYIGGGFTTVNGVARKNLAAVDPATGGGAVGGDPQVNGDVYALATAQGQGLGSQLLAAHVYAVGAFTRASSTTQNNFIRGNGAEYLEDVGGNDTLQPWDPHADERIEAIALSSTTAYLGGYFSLLGSTTRHFAGAVLRSDSTVTSWNPNLGKVGFFLQPHVASLALSGSTVYLGGKFETANGTVRRTNLAAFDATNGTVTSWDPDPPGVRQAVEQIDFDGTSILAAGEFETIGGVLRNRLAAIDLTTGQPLPFDPNLDAPVNALLLKGSTLYAGGEFQTVAGGATTRHYAAAFDTATGQPTAFNPDPNAKVVAMAQTANTIVLGGNFATVNAGARPRVRIAEVDAGSGNATAFREDVDPNYQLTALAISGDLLFVAGEIEFVGGELRRGLATIRLIAGGTGGVTSFDLGLDSYVYALLARGSTLYFSGSFGHVLGAPREQIAAVDTSNGALTAFNPGIGPSFNYANALTADDQTLFAGGSFDQAAGAARTGLAAFDLSTGALTDWTYPLIASQVPEALDRSPEGGLVVAGNNAFNSGSGEGLLLAFALPPSAPAAPAATAGAGQATVSFNAPPDGGSGITQYKVTASPGGQAATGSGSPITVTGLTPGTSYTFTVTASNAAGEGTASAPSNAVTPTSPAGGPAPPAPRAALTVSGFKLAPARFAVAKRATPLVARTHRGSVFAFKLSAAATSRIAIAHAAPGRKKGKRCVAPRKGLKRKCTRFVKVGTLVRKKTKAGANKVPFSGRMAKRALRPGRYRATLVATDSSGRRSKPVAVTFTILKG